MRAVSNFTVAPVLFALLALPAVTASAQEQDTSNPNIVVTGQEAELDMSALPKGPDIKGIVTARKANGFFLQTSGDMDANEATSQALFVFTGAAPAVLPVAALPVAALRPHARPRHPQTPPRGPRGPHSAGGS